METSKIYKKYTIVISVLMIYAALIGALIFWLFKGNGAVNDFDKLQSPVTIILAIVISVLTFTVSSAVFAAVGKSHENQALGMPEGSIRALIALSLITLFFILATQIYSRLSEGSIGKLQRVSEESLKELSIKDIISKEKSDSLKNSAYDSTKKGVIPQYVYFYNVSVKVAAGSDAADMAKNIIASFISLIAAICGFYFGSAASKQSSTPSTTTPPPTSKITPKSPIPTTGKKGTLMTFEWNVVPSGQPILVQVTPDTIQPIVDPSNPLKFTYTPSIAAAITLKVSMKNNPTVSEEYKIDVSE